MAKDASLATEYNNTGEFEAFSYWADHKKLQTQKFLKSFFIHLMSLSLQSRDATQISYLKINSLYKIGDLVHRSPPGKKSKENQKRIFISFQKKLPTA